MTLIRSKLVALPLALSVVTLASTSLAAQERTLFTWSGTVDREVLLVMRGRNVETRASGLDASLSPRLQVRDALPRSTGNINVQLVNGRGTVEIVQQPSPLNDYTTTVRIRDDRAGRDEYRIVTSWRGVSDGGSRNGNGNGGYNDRDDRGRNDGIGDRNNRDRDDDRWDDRNDRGQDSRNDRGRDSRNDRGRNDGWDNRPGNRGNNGRNAALVHWSGDVDDVSEIRITGRRVEYRNRSGAPIRNAQLDVRGGGLPRSNVNLVLNAYEGRGRIDVVQQPSRANNYTAVIRITDPRAGYGLYDFDLTW